MPRISLLSVLLLSSFGAFAQDHPSLDAVITLARDRGYTAEFVHWGNVETKAKAVAGTKGEDVAIGFVLKALGDGHSFYIPPKALGTSSAAPHPAAAQHLPRPLSQTKEPVQGVPVIEVLGWSGSSTEGATAAQMLRSQLTDALSQQQCGVVLDFSKNGGGNMWPMLGGLTPLLTEGVIGYFQDARGKSRPIEKRGDTYLLGGAPQSFGIPKGPSRAVNAQRVAVVVGPRSASSGEIVPIMFHGQGNVRLFGRPTAGRSTANSTFPLPNGGVANITTATTLDRNRVEFGAQIIPEELSDQPVLSAARWVVSACNDR